MSSVRGGCLDKVEGRDKMRLRGAGIGAARIDPPPTRMRIRRSAHTDQTHPRGPSFARRDADAWGVVLDAHGKIALRADRSANSPSPRPSPRELGEGGTHGVGG
jgi:hypothetical protein